MSRVAMVTGAGRGVGAAVASLLREGDWTVIGVDRHWPEGIPDGCLGSDLSDPTEAAEHLRELPRLDGLVNNAAICDPAPLEAIDEEIWSRTLNVNLTAALVLLQAATRQLEANHGSVVNVSSVHALATSPSNAAYAVAKAGLVGLTRSAAIELGPRGIRVNAVLPGAVDTEMLLPDGDPNRRAAAIDRLARKTPLRRVARPADIAEAVGFLLDGDRSSFITGQTITVDGGVLARLATE